MKCRFLFSLCSIVVLGVMVGILYKIGMVDYAQQALHHYCTGSSIQRSFYGKEGIMKFKNVADIFERIGAVSGRLEITELLAGLFKEVTPHEANILSNLALGTLRPSYEGVQFNFAEKNLVQVIAQLTGKSAHDVTHKAKELGDLGSVIEYFGGWHTTKELTVDQVFKELVALENVSGTGSQEEKTTMALALLRELDPVSAKYVVRIILSTLRLGFSDMTVLDALSWMEVGSKKLRPELEHAYNVCADIGLIAQTLKADGIKAIEHMHIKLGVPIRPAAAERLPTAQEIFEKLGTCVAQPKLDGFRLQIHLDKTHPKNPVVRFFSRNLIDMTNMFPDLKAAIEQLDVKQLICEGEAIVFDPNTGHFLPFQETVKRKRKHGIEEAMSEFPLQVFLFDILYLDGKSLLDEAHTQRRKQLVDIVSHSKLKENIIQVDAEKVIHSAKELEDYFLENLENGLEGVVVKRPSAHYQPGKRNFNWIKLKKMAEGHLEDTIDCVILGYYAGSGKRSTFGIGAFLVGVYNKKQDCFQSIAKIGTGLTDDEWKELKKKLDTMHVAHKPVNVECAKELFPDVWVRPDIVCMVLADEITLSPLHTAGKTLSHLGYALRFPRFMGYRPDKSVTEATEVHEVKRMYEDQYSVKKKNVE